MTRVYTLEAGGRHDGHMFLDHYDVISYLLLLGIALAAVSVAWILVTVCKRPSADQKKRF